MNLPRTAYQPGVRTDPLLRKRILNEAQRKQEVQALRTALEKWDKYLATEAGQIAKDLSEVMIHRIDRLLRLRSSDLIASFKSAPSLQEVDEIRAELRGMAKVWDLLMSEPDRLRRVLDGKEDVHGETEAGPGWEPAPKGMKETEEKS